MNEKLIAILKEKKLEHLAELFIEQGVTDSVLGDLHDGDLREIGIEKLGEPKRLLASFSEPNPAPSVVAEAETDVGVGGVMVKIEGGVIAEANGTFESRNLVPYRLNPA
jgi:hypothetical protein